MTAEEDPTGISEAERALIGTLVEGRVEAIFRWGIIVDLGLSRMGFIDPLYIDDGDHYEVGQQVRAYFTAVEDGQQKFRLRPPGQVPVTERLRRKGFDI